jgi:hypothetical protein
VLSRREPGDRFVRPKPMTSWDFWIHVIDNPQLALAAPVALVRYAGAQLVRSC